MSRIRGQLLGPILSKESAIEFLSQASGAQGRFVSNISRRELAKSNSIWIALRENKSHQRTAAMSFFGPTKLHLRNLGSKKNNAR